MTLQQAIEELRDALETAIEEGRKVPTIEALDACVILERIEDDLRNLEI
jgi:hypothetical protein